MKRDLQNYPIREDEAIPVELFLDMAMAYIATTNNFLLHTYNMIRKQEEPSRIIVAPPGAKVQ